MATAPCLIREELIKELVKAHAALAELSDRDVACIVAGDLEASDRMADELTKARKRSALASRAVRNHMFEHGC